MPSELKADVPVKIWAPLDQVESEALTQLRKTASLPWVFHHLAAMADCHAGKGCVIGTVIAMKDAICPAAVGVDIGCGMQAVRTSLKASDLPDSLVELRTRIEAVVPVGNGGGSWHLETPRNNADAQVLWSGFKDLHPKVQDLLDRANRQMGTLGGGNHFVEICLDTEQNVWVMLHSGSRNIGKTLAEIHMGIAAELTHNAAIIDRDLACFLSGTDEMNAYLRDLLWAQEYAAWNRVMMMNNIKYVLQEQFPKTRFDDPVACHHNYVAIEHHFGEDVYVTRKGAISARAGQLGIIPGSMGTASFIVRGLGNPESFHSASHGAGRRMSRGAAKRAFTVEDVVEQTKGVECRKDKAIIDEIPGAYKDIHQVMANQRDLVEVVAELKQVLVVKG